MSTMRSRREGLLAQIEASAVDDAVPLSSLLQKCVVLGGQTGVGVIGGRRHRSGAGV